MHYYSDHKKWAKKDLGDAIRMARDYSCSAGVCLVHGNELRYNRLMKCSYLIQMAIVRKYGGLK